MWYMGGKFRQSKGICEAIMEHSGQGFNYCEPFMGGAWSAAAVISRLNPKKVILFDISMHLMAFWWEMMYGDVEIPTVVTDEQYEWYKSNKPMDDPLTAWFGYGISFGGKWFGGLARHVKGRMESYDFSPEAKSVMRKVDCMRRCSDMHLLCGSYEEIIDDLSGYVIYCDPPYEGRTKAHDFASFNYDEFWVNMRKASINNEVYISCFDCPDDFSPVYEWGDTVIRHLNSKGTDGTNEKLVVYEGGRIK